MVAGQDENLFCRSFLNEDKQTPEKKSKPYARQGGKISTEIEGAEQSKEPTSAKLNLNLKLGGLGSGPKLNLNALQNSKLLKGGLNLGQKPTLD